MSLELPQRTPQGDPSGWCGNNDAAVTLLGVDVSDATRLLEVAHEVAPKAIAAARSRFRLVFRSGFFIIGSFG